MVDFQVDHVSCPGYTFKTYICRISKQLLPLKTNAFQSAMTNLLRINTLERQKPWRLSSPAGLVKRSIARDLSLVLDKGTWLGRKSTFSNRKFYENLHAWWMFN